MPTRFSSSFRRRTAGCSSASPDGDLLRFDIHLQGENETPFFAF